MNISRAAKITGWMKPVELRWLAQQASQCTTILEVGSYHGRSTTAILDNSTAYIWCVDLWGTKAVTEKDYQKFVRNMRPYTDRLTVIREQGKTALRKLLKGKVRFDLVFIDGGHSYKIAHSDIKLSIPLVKPGGLLCGHDFSQRAWPDVVRAVKELVPNYNRVKGTSLWWKQM